MLELIASTLLGKEGRRHEKRYGSIFTCMAVQAEHVEKLYSIDAICSFFLVFNMGVNGEL